MQQDNKNDGLLHQGVSAAVWSSLGAAARILLQVGAQIALARILGPETYGLFAISLTIVLFAAMFSDFGLSYGLIQRPDVTDEDIRFVFTWQMVLGLLATGLIALSASPIAKAFGDVRLEAVVRTLSLSCTIAAFGSTANMLLRRRLDFKAVNIAVVVSYAIGFLLVGLSLALLGFGVWALVAANLTQLALAAALTYRSVRHDLTPTFRHADWRNMLGFGSTVFATNLLNWIMSSLDRLVIGLTMPIAAAGLYSTIGNLMIAPVLTLNGVLQSALYAASARAQNDPERLRRALRTVLAAVMLIFAPVFAAIGVTAEAFIDTLYGEKWLGGGAVLRPIAFAVPAMLLMGMAIPTLWASGKTKWEFKLQLPMALVWALLLFPIASYGSLALLSWCVCAWFYVRAAVVLTAACHAVQMPLIECLKPMRAGAIVTVAVAAAAWLGDHIGLKTPWIHEAAIVAACIVTMAVALMLVRPLLSDDLRQLLARASDWVPHPMLRDSLRRRILMTS